MNGTALHRPCPGNMLITAGEEKRSQRSHRVLGRWACNDRMPWGLLVLTKIKCLTSQFLIELFLCGGSYRLFRISLARDTFRPASLKAQLIYQILPLYAEPFWVQQWLRRLLFTILAQNSCLAGVMCNLFKGEFYVSPVETEKDWNSVFGSLNKVSTLLEQ